MSVGFLQLINEKSRVTNGTRPFFLKLSEKDHPVTLGALMTSGSDCDVQAGCSSVRPELFSESILFEQIRTAKQFDLLKLWNRVSDSERASLIQQFKRIDWNLVARLRNEYLQSPTVDNSRARQAQPLQRFIRLPKTASDRVSWESAALLGKNVIENGRIAVLLVAGGQGSRLGFPHPKGTFPIEPMTGKSLFQLFSEQILAISKLSNVRIPYLIMTGNEASHDETVVWFEDHHFFGLNPDDVFFFAQRCMPTIDSQTGNVLLATKTSLHMCPDGHGGVVDALGDAGMFQKMRIRGIEYLFYHQVDNPLVRICDPAFVGLHVCNNAEVSTKVVAKRCAAEKMGVLVELDGRVEVIEYSEVPPELAIERNASGDLQFWAGNTAIHIFNLSFLETVAKSQIALPWHAVSKMLSALDEYGSESKLRRGVKFERFIFDVLPQATSTLVVEALRDREFAPLKNEHGDFSPSVVQKAILRLVPD